MSGSADESPASQDKRAVDTAGLARRSVRGSVVIGVSQGLKMVMQFGSQLVLARLLFPADYGLLGMVYPILAFIQIFNDLGLGQIIIQRPTLDQARLSALFWVNIGVGTVLGLLLLLVSPLAAWLYGEPRVIGIMAVLAPILPIAALGIHPSALLLRRMQFGLIARNDVRASLIGVVVTTMSAWLGLSYWSLILGMFCTTLTSIIGLWRVSGWRPSRPAFHEGMWADLRVGGNITGANLATYVTTSSDNIIIGTMNGKVPLGLYDRSYRLVVQPLSQMSAPIGRVALPLLSRLADNPKEYRVAYLRIARFMMLLTMPLMLVCVVHAQTIIDTLLGSRWQAAGPIFAWISVGGLTASIYSTVIWLFVSQGRTREMRNYLAVAAGLNLGSFLVGSVWGIVAVAGVAASVFVLITTPLVLFGASRSGPVRSHDMAVLLGTFALKGGVAYILLRAQAAMLPVSGLVQIVLALSVAYAAFGILAMVIPAERRLLLPALATILRSLRRVPG